MALNVLIFVFLKFKCWSKLIQVWFNRIHWAPWMASALWIVGPVNWRTLPMRKGWGHALGWVQWRFPKESMYPSKTIRNWEPGKRLREGSVASTAHNLRSRAWLGSYDMECLRGHHQVALNGQYIRHLKSIECLKACFQCFFITLFSQQVWSSKKLPNPAPPFKKNSRAQF